MGGPSEASSPLRIAHLTTADISLALLLSTELAERVSEGDTVFGISASGRYVERVEALGVTHVPVRALSRSWGLVRDARAFVELFGAIRSLDLDVLHTHNPKTGVMGRIAGRLAGVPVVVNTCHGLWATPDDPLAKRAFVYGLEGLAARFSDYELFQNAQDERTLRRFLKPGRHKIVGNGIDLDRFRFDPTGRARLRAEWGVAGDELLVGTVGRRVREKGLAEFAAAAHDLKDQARFVWVGPMDDTDAAALAGIDVSAVQFIREQTDMPAVYSAFDIFVLASYREGFSRASMEAAACGRAMILTDIRGCREIGEDGVQVRRVPPRDAGALTWMIRHLGDHPCERDRLARAAQERAIREFDQREVARISREAYAELAPKGLNSFHNDRRVLVLHVIPADQSRGAQIYLAQLRTHLRRDPDQQHVVVSLFDGPPGGLDADIKLQAPSRTGRRLGLDLRAVRCLRRLVRLKRPALVVAHGGESLKYAIASADGVPVVYYKVGLSSTQLSRNAHKRLYRFLASRASHVVAVSSAVAAQCRDVLEVPSSKLSVIPNGRDPSQYLPGSPAEKSDPPLVLWVGQFEEGKRPALFLDVVERLRNLRVDCRAMMVGDGSLRPLLQERATDLGVSLPGGSRNVPAHMQAATVLAITSAPDTEGMPGVLIEAALSGLPVVAMLAAGVDDVVLEGLTGFIVADADAAAMSSRLHDILLDGALAARLGEEARRRATDRYTLASTARLWLELARDVARPCERGL